MTPREWIALAGLLSAFMGGMIGIIKWLVSDWMRGVEAQDRQLAGEIHKLTDELRVHERTRMECQGRHDRDLARIELEIKSNYLLRSELQGIVGKIESKLDELSDKIDDLKDRLRAHHEHQA